ncbi:stress responsive protein [Williamsia sp. 1138]|uniref:Dabb family protein n=1 Tax=Williamsia sp. 1138 TaxID=1903117 RepID=UPI000A0F588A|nr:Dabb family protein [Williamsia sp. 1138]OZG28713.1 stress responsive protein [Williamsia sp. 1138]
MYKVTSLIHTASTAPAETTSQLVGALRETAKSLNSVQALIEPTLPGVRNGGDILMHLQVEDAAHWRAIRASFDHILDGPAIDHVDEVEYVPGRSSHGSTATATVYRTLLLRVEDGTAPASIRRFEAELMRMPAFIETITAWRLSEVVATRGSTRYTHVWEQEFTDLDGLMGPYLAHPVHWAYVDKWFDPECPEIIVRDRVCHSFCNLEHNVIDVLVTEMTA